MKQDGLPVLLECAMAIAGLALLCVGYALGRLWYGWRQVIDS